MRKLLVLFILLVVNLFYYRTMWGEFRRDTQSVEARYGEVIAAEMSMEQVYQNIMSHKSPFSLRTDEFYPFGTSFTATDPGNGLYFVLLRPFASTHQAMILISMFSINMAGLGMYLLLRLLRIQWRLSLILGLAFAYTTFLLPRAGHLTYFSTYVFPWFFVSSYLALHGNRLLTRLAGGVSAAVFTALALYHNSYYFVTLGLIVVFLTSYYLIYRRSVVWRYAQTRSRELIIFMLATLLLLAPWIQQVLQDRLFEGLPTTSGWGGAINYSSDLFGYFVPSPYSRYLSFAATWMDSHFMFARGIFENYSYPGILFLLTFVLLAYLLWHKHLPLQLRQTISPLLLTTFGIWILTLGPFLHVAGKWAIGLPDEIKLVVPLPFALFHYLPFMENIRSPARLTIGFIFVGYIIAAMLWQWGWQRMNKFQRNIFLVVLFSIFALDHTLVYTPASPRVLPTTYYEVIKADQAFGSVLEIPSTIRDGFTYFGSGNDLDFIAGQMIHGKPIIGGYLGRVASYKIKYVQDNPFLGYVGRLTDPDVAHNGSLDRTALPEWERIDITASTDAIDLLDLSYVILKNDAVYSATMSGVLDELGFVAVRQSPTVSLWHRTPSSREFLQVTIGQAGDDFMLAGGWYGRDQGFRFMRESAQILFKVAHPRAMTLGLTAASYHLPQEMTVYINRQLVSRFQLRTEEQSYTFSVPPELVRKGINIVQVIASEARQPQMVDQSSTDTNFLSAQFSEAYLK